MLGGKGSLENRAIGEQEILSSCEPIHLDEDGDLLVQRPCKACIAGIVIYHATSTGLDSVGLQVGPQ
jgi:hypothetical protein